MQSRLLVAVCLMTALTLIVLPTSATRKSDAIEGRWDLTIQGTDAPYSSWLEVTKDSTGKLTGRFVGRFGSARPIQQIEFNNNSIKFALPPQYEQRKDDLVFNGRLTGGKLGGTTVGEDGKTLNWTGVHAPELKPNANPKWGAPVQLFNGKDLNGWRLRADKGRGCWTVEDGSITNAKGCVDLITEQNFKDFKLSLEFRLADPQTNGGQPSNSGIHLRGRYEVQVLDDYGKPAESHGMGGLYGFLTPKTNASKKAGEWDEGSERRSL